MSNGSFNTIPTRSQPTAPPRSRWRSLTEIHAVFVVALQQTEQQLPQVGRRLSGDAEDSRGDTLLMENSVLVARDALKAGEMNKQLGAQTHHDGRVIGCVDMGAAVSSNTSAYTEPFLSLHVLYRQAPHGGALLLLFYVHVILSAHQSEQTLHF